MFRFPIVCLNGIAIMCELVSPRVHQHTFRYFSIHGDSFIQENVGACLRLHVLFPESKKHFNAFIFLAETNWSCKKLGAFMVMHKKCFSYFCNHVPREIFIHLVRLCWISEKVNFQKSLLNKPRIKDISPARESRVGEKKVKIHGKLQSEYFPFFKIPSNDKLWSSRSSSAVNFW